MMYFLQYHSSAIWFVSLRITIFIMVVFLVVYSRREMKQNQQLKGDGTLTAPLDLSAATNSPPRTPSESKRNSDAREIDAFAHENKSTSSSSSSNHSSSNRISEVLRHTQTPVGALDVDNERGSSPQKPPKVALPQSVHISSSRSVSSQKPPRYSPSPNSSSSPLGVISRRLSAASLSPHNSASTNTGDSPNANTDDVVMADAPSALSDSAFPPDNDPPPPYTSPTNGAQSPPADKPSIFDLSGSHPAREETKNGANSSTNSRRSAYDNNSDRKLPQTSFFANSNRRRSANDPLTAVEHRDRRRSRSRPPSPIRSSDGAAATRVHLCGSHHRVSDRRRSRSPTRSDAARLRRERIAARVRARDTARRTLRARREDGAARVHRRRSRSRPRSPTRMDDTARVRRESDTTHARLIGAADRHHSRSSHYRSANSRPPKLISRSAKAENKFSKGNFEDLDFLNSSSGDEKQFSDSDKDDDVNGSGSSPQKSAKSSENCEKPEAPKSSTPVAPAENKSGKKKPSSNEQNNRPDAYVISDDDDSDTESVTIPHGKREVTDDDIQAPKKKETSEKKSKDVLCAIDLTQTTSSPVISLSTSSSSSASGSTNATGNGNRGNDTIGIPTIDSPLATCFDQPSIAPAHSLDSLMLPSTDLSSSSSQVPTTDYLGSLLTPGCAPLPTLSSVLSFDQNSGLFDPSNLNSSGNSAQSDLDVLLSSRTPSSSTSATNLLGSSSFGPDSSASTAAAIDNSTNTDSSKKSKNPSKHVAFDLPPSTAHTLDAIPPPSSSSNDASSSSSSSNDASSSSSSSSSSKKKHVVFGSTEIITSDDSDTDEESSQTDEELMGSDEEKEDAGGMYVFCSSCVLTLFYLSSFRPLRQR